MKKGFLPRPQRQALAGSGCGLGRIGCRLSFQPSLSALKRSGVRPMLFGLPAECRREERVGVEMGAELLDEARGEWRTAEVVDLSWHRMARLRRPG